MEEGRSRVWGNRNGDGKYHGNVGVASARTGITISAGRSLASSRDLP